MVTSDLHGIEDGDGMILTALAEDVPEWERVPGTTTGVCVMCGRVALLSPVSQSIIAEAEAMNLRVHVVCGRELPLEVLNDSIGVMDSAEGMIEAMRLERDFKIGGSES